MDIVFLALFWLAISLSRAEESNEVCNSTSESDVFCPPWFVQEPNSTQCKCGSTVGGLVKCQSDEHYSPPYYYISLPWCYCMTAHIDCNSSAVIFGSCPYSCSYEGIWFPDPQKLNAKVCEETWNRTGPLCARCQEGLGPPVYSYLISCIPCNAMSTELVKFVAASFVPLTLFCLGIIVFRISATKPPWDIFIFVSQILAAPQYMQVIQPIVQGKSLPNTVHVMCWKLFSTFFGVWNLDFFRSFYPPVCLSSHMTSLQAIFLEYTIGLYPLLMIVVIYVIVQLYDHRCTRVRHNCRLCCCVPLLRRFDIRSSLIDAFATFLVLAYIKIGYTSVSILMPTAVYTPDGAYKLYVFVDASMEYMGTEHLKYALPAVFTTLLFNVLPLLFLILFPLTCFQRGLNYCGCRCLTLRIFSDAFQGCYKDGTEGTRDYRWFSGLQLFMRFAIVIIFEIERHHLTIIVLAMILVIVYLAMIETMQPYKHHRNMNLYFKINAGSVLLLSLSLWMIGKITFHLQRDSDKTRFAIHSSLLIVSSLIPFCYAVGLSFYWLFAVKQCGRKAISVLWKCLKKQNEQEQLLQNSS